MEKGTEALFRNEIENGSDPDLKDFARKTLPRIVDHLDRALKLAGEKRHRDDTLAVATNVCRRGAFLGDRPSLSRGRVFSNSPDRIP